MLYAIVDIETTGGYANASGITEIAIIVTDGNDIIEQFETLINPAQKIPYFITKLTGINDAMVATAPYFEEVAEKIYNILHDKIFVAHNVNFDYSFVNAQLKANDFSLNCPKLCTIRYGRKVITGLSSYGLGNFCRAVGITINDRHRAGGDCIATFYLLKKILNEDINDELSKFIKNKNKERNLPLQLNAEDYHNLPKAIGVYYFLDKKEKIIYIGKAINIKKRVTSHFSGNSTSKQRQEFIRNIAFIKYQLAATELMCLILESIEIKKYWPKYNQSQKYFEHQFAIYNYQDQNGYERICVDKKKKNLPSIITIKNKVEGLILLRKTALEFNLCPNYCMVGYIANETLHNNCNGICTQFTNTKKYNTKVKLALKKMTENSNSFLIIDEGLQSNEQSIIAVKNGIFVGMGYAPSKIKLKKWETINDNIQLLPTNNYINGLVNKYSEMNNVEIIKTKKH